MGLVIVLQTKKEPADDGVSRSELDQCAACGV